MIGDLRHLISKHPFSPFVIHMADGEAVRVPTVDHIAIALKGARVVVFDDQGAANILSPLLMTRITTDVESAERPITS